MRLYQAALERGRLLLRVRTLLLISPGASARDRIREIEGFALRSGFGNDWLGVWGLRFVLDGGPEGGALEAPYANDPGYSGHLNWEPEEMFAIMSAAVKMGWRIGTHAIGDRAVRTLIDVYERVIQAVPGLPPGTLVIEHAFLSDKAQRTRAIRLGVWVTVQHALLYGLGGSLVKLWGPDRARHVMPVKAWVDEGAELSGGTDYPISFYEPMQSVWGMVTRQTRDAGIQGPEYGIDVQTALSLCTTAGARLSGESDRLGTLEPGKLADIVAFRSDPTRCPIDELPSLKPVLTLVGGRATHDPEGLVATQA